VVLRVQKKKSRVVVHFVRVALRYISPVAMAAILRAGEFVTQLILHIIFVFLRILRFL